MDGKKEIESILKKIRNLRDKFAIFDKDNKKIESAVTEDYISNNFNGVLDLSSRTPFIRMWTAVQVFTSNQIKDVGPYEPKTQA